MQTSMGRTMLLLSPCCIHAPCLAPCILAMCFVCLPSSAPWFRWAGPRGLVNDAFYVSSALSGV